MHSRIVSTVFSVPAEAANGDTATLEASNSATEEEYYRVSEQIKPRILWNFTRKVLLTASDTEAWCTAIKSGDSTIALSEFDLTRVLKSQFSDLVDNNEQKYHGCIFVDLKPLLGKAVLSIVGRFKVALCPTVGGTERVNNEGDADVEIVCALSYNIYYIVSLNPF